MDHLRLSLASVEWLVDDSGLAFAPTSPLGFLRTAPRRSTAAERASAAQTELVARGVSFARRGSRGSAAAGSEYGEAIETLASPERRIQIVVQSPGKETVTMSLFARAGKACVFFFDQQSFHVGPRRDVEVTVGTLLEQLRAPKELEGQQILFWPGILGLLTLLWPGAGQDLDQPVPRTEALRRLGSPGVAAGKAEAAVDELVAARILESRDDTLTVPSALRPWLQVALGGHFVQIDVLPLDEADALANADERTARLLFAGPPGQRVLSRRLEGDALSRVLEGAPPTEPRAIHLMALPPDRLAALLREHLGVTAPAPSRK